MRPLLCSLFKKVVSRKVPSLNLPIVLDFGPFVCQCHLMPDKLCLSETQKACKETTINRPKANPCIDGSTNACGSPMLMVAFVRWRPKWSVVRFQWCQFVVRFISGNSNSKLRLEASRRLTE